MLIEAASALAAAMPWLLLGSDPGGGGGGGSGSGGGDSGSGSGSTKRVLMLTSIAWCGVCMLSIYAANGTVDGGVTLECTANVLLAALLSLQQGLYS